MSESTEQQDEHCGSGSECGEPDSPSAGPLEPIEQGIGMLCEHILSTQPRMSHSEIISYARKHKLQTDFPL